MLEGERKLFDASKYFTYIKPLGRGGTGHTHLFKDETTNMTFAIKKYSPIDISKREEYYKRFVDEISILFKISHPNIVRIYNYYLYPGQTTGYLQMEYIDGLSIDNYQPFLFGGDWNEIFKDVISAFEYLEKINILHRDIRPSNILITEDCKPKIIDFGFGKMIEKNEKDINSVLLNWPATQMPEEIALYGDYTFATEIFFVGTLFQKLLNDDQDFKYYRIVNKMTQFSPKDRYASFKDISSEILEEVLSDLDFTVQQKSIYQKFANNLVSHIAYYRSEFESVAEISTVISRLAEVLSFSALENYLQANDSLIRCFIKNGYSYSPEANIEVSCIVKFYQFFTTIGEKKQRIILNNLNTRLAKIRVKYPDIDIPF